ncbi:MAG: hypothetical protein JWN64_355 [Parcubacteria group bacterium]|nr:hypothetical protein [Parcubacteria group bacterium]
MRRFAFIDVPNTTGTTKNVLGFSIDWSKLYELLVNDKWSCTSVFFYKGHKGEKEKEQLERIEEMGYVVRTKLTHIHPNTIKEIEVACPKCHGDFTYKETVKGNQKSNCDVELTVDALETIREGDQALIFTGDGDFAYLIEKLLEKGATVRIVSSQNKDFFNKNRFSTRLKAIIEREDLDQRRVQFIHIKNWQRTIEKGEETDG